jgi:PIN domain nuclease of toxin-antitoxin system
VRLLLDTHIFIWWATQLARLSPRALALCNDPLNTLILSVASVWEMQIKLQLGKMHFQMPFQTLIRNQHQTNGLQLLPVELNHILEL